MPPFSFGLSGGGSFGGSAGGPSYWNQGTWNVNLGGSGTALQSATGGALSPLMLLALAAGAAWLLLRK